MVKLHCIFDNFFLHDSRIGGERGSAISHAYMGIIWADAGFAERVLMRCNSAVEQQSVEVYWKG